MDAIVESISACARACRACADACRREPTADQLSACIRADDDCAAVCDALIDVLGRGDGGDPRILDALLAACVIACDVCSGECERHAAHMDHCRVCAEACRAAVAACKAHSRPGEEPSLAAVVEKLQKNGFPCTFEVLPHGAVHCHACQGVGPASELVVQHYRRFEGPTDPDDEVMVVAAAWPRPGGACRGVLVLGFGPMASAEHKQVLSALNLHPLDSGSPVPS